MTNAGGWRGSWSLDIGHWGFFGHWSLRHWSFPRTTDLKATLMKKTNPTLLVLLFLLTLSPLAALAQTTAYPPERLAFQGFAADGNGVGLATNAPKNYDIIFR